MPSQLLAHPLATPVVRPGLRILVLGANFTNQGAYLMLRAVVQELRERFDAQPVLDLRTGTERQKRALGIDTLWTPKLGRRLGRMDRGWVPRTLGDRSPYLVASQIDAVVDVSGFRYGDQWAHLALQDRADYLQYWNAHDVPVYLLPQAFGPFEKTSAPASTALRSARLVLPRDPDSEGYVRGLLGPEASDTVFRFPDFTATVKGRFPAARADLRGAVPIVPNWNIAERAADGGVQYVDNLAAIARHLRSRGIRPYGLSHEGQKDVELLGRVVEQVPDLEVVSGLNGVELKGLLGESSLVVSGRFHALVSSLSQGVPSVMHGWSHKYRWLAADYGAESTRVDPVGSVQDNLAAVDRASQDAGLPAEIRRHAAERRADIERMWELVGARLPHVVDR